MVSANLLPWQYKESGFYKTLFIISTVIIAIMIIIIGVLCYLTYKYHSKQYLQLPTNDL